MRRWSKWLVVPTVVLTCAAAMVASGGATAGREQASTVSAVGRDTDHDGLSDEAERRYHTDPRKRDTDGDGLQDGAEVNVHHTNPRRPDTDRDGLQDGVEVKRYHTDPRKRDTDGDGLQDGAEVEQRKTNPRERDTDGDGWGDGVEIKRDTDPHNARSRPGFPREDNTGVPAGTPLTPTNLTTVSTNNAVVNAVSTSGCLEVTGYGVTIKNSKVGCVIVDGGIAGNPANPPLTIQDTEIVCPLGAWNTGFRFDNTILLRVNIHGCENGLDIGNHVTLRDSYIHDLTPGPTYHNDGMQGGNPTDVTIEHNTIYGIDTSAIGFNSSASGTVLIQNNLLAGGAYTLYCPKTTTTNFQVIGNRFSTIFYPKVGFFGPSTDCADEIQSGNVYHETGRPLNLG